MTSRFVQLLQFTPAAGAPRLMALDDDGSIWVWSPANGWRMWTEQRQGGVGKDPTS